MKPWGMDAMFRIHQPSREEDAIWEAVEMAQDAGWTAEQFKREVQAAWTGMWEERARTDRLTWDKP